MNLGKKILAATALTGVLAMAGLGAVQAGNSSAETPVFQQDEDLLRPQDRVLSRNPHRHPGWTWMTESQAILLLKANGFSDVLSLEKAGSSWRGKAIKDYLSYHVAIDRYAGLVAHLDKKSREQHAVAEQISMAQRSLSYCDQRRIC
jgi:hypothetical protein